MSTVAYTTTRTIVEDEPDEFRLSDKELDVSDLIHEYGFSLFQLVFPLENEPFRCDLIYEMLRYKYFNAEQRVRMLEAFIENRPKAYEQPFSESQMMHVLEDVLVLNYRFKNSVFESFLDLKSELRACIPIYDAMSVEFLYLTLENHQVIVRVFAKNFEPEFCLVILPQSLLVAIINDKQRLVSLVQRAIRKDFRPSLPVKLAFVYFSPNANDHIEVQGWKESQGIPVFQLTFLELSTWLRTITEFQSVQKLGWFLEDVALWIERNAIPNHTNSD